MHTSAIQGRGYDRGLHLVKAQHIFLLNLLVYRGASEWDTRRGLVRNNVTDVINVRHMNLRSTEIKTVSHCPEIIGSELLYHNVLKADGSVIPE